MESSDQKVWVKYGTGHAVKVSVSPECDVSDLIKVIKGELSRKLTDVDPDEISLHGPEEERKEGGEGTGSEGETAYEPDVLVSAILRGGVGQTARNPIFIRTAQEAPAPATAASAAPAGADPLVREIHEMVAGLISVYEDNVLLDAVSTVSEREYHHQQFEDEVSQGYGCINTLAHPHMLRCIVTNQFHPQKAVCKGAHIISLKEKKALSLIGLESSAVWDPRNGLCVLRSIAQRFESKELVYMPHLGQPDEYHVEVLYDDILNKPLGITKGELNGTKDSSPATFQDINKRPLAFTTHIRPYKRALLFIAYSAFSRALENSRRSHTLAAAASPANAAEWRNLFENATNAGSPPLLPDGFIMKRFLSR